MTQESVSGPGSGKTPGAGSVTPGPTLHTQDDADQDEAIEAMLETESAGETMWRRAETD